MGFHCLESTEISLTRLKQLLWKPFKAFWKFLTSFFSLQNAVQLISNKNTLYIISCCVQSPPSNNTAVCLGTLPCLENVLLPSPYSTQTAGMRRKTQAFPVLIVWCLRSWERKCDRSCTAFTLVSVSGVQRGKWTIMVLNPQPIPEQSTKNSEGFFLRDCVPSTNTMGADSTFLWHQ